MARTPLLRIDTDRQEVFVKGGRVHLTNVQFRILAALKKTNRILPRTALLEQIWDSDESFDKDPRTVDQHVSRLRSRLAARARNVQFIETVLGVGYKYIGS